MALETRKIINEFENSSSDSEVYCVYEPKNSKLYKKHPGDVVEASSLAVSYKDIFYYN